jgi:excisionase family DNA binding protein
MDQLSDLLTINTFRRKLGLSRKTVYRWIASGAVRSVRVGGQWRIPRYEVCLVRCKGVRRCCAPETCLYRQYQQQQPWHADAPPAA